MTVENFVDNVDKYIGASVGQYKHTEMLKIVKNKHIIFDIFVDSILKRWYSGSIGRPTFKDVPHRGWIVCFVANNKTHYGIVDRFTEKTIIVINFDNVVKRRGVRRSNVKCYFPLSFS